MAQKHYEVEGKRCPRCGAILITDGYYAWCTFIGGWISFVRIYPCSFGTNEKVPLTEIDAVAEREKVDSLTWVI